MDQTLFYGGIEGLMLEQVVREHEFTMPSRHFHATYELYFLLEGERYYFIDNETYLVRAGDTVMIKPDRVHKTTQSGDASHKRFLMQIDGAFIDPVLKAAGFGGIDEIYGAGFRILTLPGPLREEVLARVGRIRRELQLKRRDHVAAIRLEAAGLLLSLRRCQGSGAPEASLLTARTVKHQKVHEAARYLTEHPETGESLEELARRFYISKSYLSRIFKEVTGLSVNEFRSVSRIKRSQQMLLHSEMRITDIAGLVGFESLTYFERVFKKYADITPLQFRKRGPREMRFPYSSRFL